MSGAQRLRVVLNGSPAPRLYNGRHVKKCPCYDCVKERAARFAERVREMEQARPPASAQHTIPVRAHWRRSAKHLLNDPELRRLVAELVREEMRRAKARR